jgi:Fe-S cluster biogenesis protein NfuA
MVRALLELHATGLARILELTGSETVVGLAADELVSSLLLLHGLHPHPASERVAAALERARPRFRALGGDVELIEATEARVRVRLLGDPSAALRTTIEEAVIGAVPDLVALEFEAARDSSAPRIPLTLLV